MTAHHARAEYAAINRADPAHIPAPPAIVDALWGQAFAAGMERMQANDVEGAVRICEQFEASVRMWQEAAK